MCKTCNCTCVHVHFWCRDFLSACGHVSVYMCHVQARHVVKMCCVYSPVCWLMNNLELIYCSLKKLILYAVEKFKTKISLCCSYMYVCTYVHVYVCIYLQCKEKERLRSVDPQKSRCNFLITGSNSKFPTPHTYVAPLYSTILLICI